MTEDKRWPCGCRPGPAGHTALCRLGDRAHARKLEQQASQALLQRVLKLEVQVRALAQRWGAEAMAEEERYSRARAARGWRRWLGWRQWRCRPRRAQVLYGCADELLDLLL